MDDDEMRPWWELALKNRVARLKRLEDMKAPAIIIAKEKELIATARRKLGQH